MLKKTLIATIISLFLTLSPLCSIAQKHTGHESGSGTTVTAEASAPADVPPTVSMDEGNTTTTTTTEATLSAVTHEGNDSEKELLQQDDLIIPSDGILQKS
jgi:hypothetical protein